MSLIHDILLKHWGFSAFRPLQEDIINSVLEGKDTLALLPTGGGKSVCFQVPALASDGICLVITPLIALMKDQVENLKSRDIKAAAIYSGMSRDEIARAIDNSIFGDNKFLYVSPERLESDSFRENIKRMKINLLAIDEAHCISQWGYDFRPSYLNITQIRQFIPNVPLLALTATATPEVVTDIQAKLSFQEDNLYQKSFERKNITYVVAYEEDKYKKLLKIVNGVGGTGIVYVRNRRKTKEIAEFLVKKGLRADFYHAGLDPKQREYKQDAWKSDKIQIIVSTNAFGMGIDKPDVRFVVHMDYPDSLEAYFQEAGRGGRDEKRAYAVLLYEKADILNAKQNLKLAFPGINTIKTIYNALGNYFQLAVGSGKDVGFDFELVHFCENYSFQPMVVFNALKFLEKEGYLFISDAFNTSSKVFIKSSRETLYQVQVSNQKYDHLIKLLLRSYSGLFSDYTRINEKELAKRADLTENQVVEILKKLDQLDVLYYIPQLLKPQLIFLTPRLSKRNLDISPRNYTDREKAASRRLDAVIRYAESSTICRSKALLSYFGEKDSTRCGRCDVCLEMEKIRLSNQEFERINQKIRSILMDNESTLEKLVEDVGERQEERVIEVIRWLVDNEKVIKLKNTGLKWNKKKLR